MILICWLNTVYLNILYFKHGLATGVVLTGHDFKYIDGVLHDHWLMECTRCGVRAGIYEKPPL